MAYAVPAPGNGVPAVLGGSSLSAAALSITSLADAPGLGSALGSQWGFFQNGQSVVLADTVLGVDYRQEWVIADHPVEGGGFETFNKVQRPFDVRFRFAAGANVSTREEMVNSIAAIAGTMNLYTAATPEVVYQNVCISHYDYHRVTEQGVGLMVVDVWGWQIVIASATQTFDTPQVGGAVQSPTVTSDALSQAGSLWGGDGITSVSGLEQSANVSITSDQAYSPGATTFSGGSLTGSLSDFPGPISGPN